LISIDSIEPSWKDSIYRQREEMARMLREPLALLASKCIPVWDDRDRLNEVLLEGFSSIPYCTYLYVVDTHGVQISDHISHAGLIPEHYHLNRAERPYMKEAMPAWGFLLSDGYVNQEEHWPSITALQVVVSDAGTLGNLGADFDLRSLPVTSALYQEPSNWRQVKGDPAIRGNLFQQTRTESPMDRNIQNALSILEELLTERGIFQCQMLQDTDICLLYPSRPYPADAAIPRDKITRILDSMQSLRMVDTTIYLRTASINIFNGMLSLTFSCDGSHYMRFDEFLAKGPAFWSGVPA
jgi:hypothetical protein